MTVSLTQAQAQLGELIQKLPAGEELIITQGDRAIARLKSETPMEQRQGPGVAKGLIEIVNDDDEHLKGFEGSMP